MRFFASLRMTLADGFLVLVSDISKNLRVVPAGVLLLSFPKRDVVGDTADSSVNSGILLRHFDRNTDWRRRNAAGPIKLDMPRAYILFSFLHRIGRVPGRLRGNATRSDEEYSENAQDFHLTRE